MKVRTATGGIMGMTSKPVLVLFLLLALLFVASMWLTSGELGSESAALSSSEAVSAAERSLSPYTPAPSAARRTVSISAR